MEEQLLKDYSDTEKGAYLRAIASIASADRNASEEELEFLEALAENAQVSEVQKNSILQAAHDPSNVSLEKCLETLKSSELKYSLITDVISFAKSDGKYSLEEEQKIREMAQYLGINAEQMGTLSTFVEKAEEANRKGEDVSQANFLNSSGLGNMFQKAGIPTGGILKGLLGMVAPMIIGRMLSGRRGNNMNRGGGLGDVLGGALGGGMGGGGLLGGLLGGNNNRGVGNQNNGGLGSLISVLSGGRGYGGMGNILSSFLKRR